VGGCGVHRPAKKPSSGNNDVTTYSGADSAAEPGAKANSPNVLLIFEPYPSLAVLIRSFVPKVIGNNRRVGNVGG
jgi:hypothetical protein